MKITNITTSVLFLILLFAMPGSVLANDQPSASDQGKSSSLEKVLTKNKNKIAPEALKQLAEQFDGPFGRPKGKSSAKTPDPNALNTSGIRVGKKYLSIRFDKGLSSLKKNQVKFQHNRQNKLPDMSLADTSVATEADVVDKEQVEVNDQYFLARTLENKKQDTSLRLEATDLLGQYDLSHKRACLALIRTMTDKKENQQIRQQAFEAYRQIIINTQQKTAEKNSENDNNESAVKLRQPPLAVPANTDAKFITGKKNVDVKPTADNPHAIWSKLPTKLKPAEKSNKATAK